eukprot:g10301.t1
MPAPQSPLKATQSATALKAAACATLNDTGGYVNNATMKPGNKTMPSSKKVTMLKQIETIWDEPDDKMHEQKRTLQGSVFEEETRARQEQRHLMDELHGEQMKRIDEIEDGDGESPEKLDQAMKELKAYIEEFMQKIHPQQIRPIMKFVMGHNHAQKMRQLRFRKELDDTFTALFSELRVQVERITPRIAALEARGRVLRNGIEEERVSKEYRQDRIRHYAEILVPVKAQIAKIEQGLNREEKEEMCRHFLPILRDKGTRIKKNGMRLARPARPNEEVLTIVNGELLIAPWLCILCAAVDEPATRFLQSRAVKTQTKGTPADADRHDGLVTTATGGAQLWLSKVALNYVAQELLPQILRNLTRVLPKGFIPRNESTLPN